ncbi:MAG TPA: nitroreductase/quinone reductase family protein [Blastocatellia bacterium]|nr:nitroreductase/quinone reductase family protein [Blastocatellia bacterium]
MFIAGFERLQADFFRGLNQFVEPLVRAGLGAPVLFPAGAIVVETLGRKSGRRLNVPLVAALVGDLVVVSTVRRRSNWLRNLSEHPNVRYWLGGREREATAFAIGPGIEAPEDSTPQRVRCLADALRQHSSLFGTGFAILIPRESLGASLTNESE